MEYKLQVYKLRLVRSSTRSVKVEVVKQPEDAASALRAYLENEDREHFVALLLDVKGRRQTILS